MTVLVLSEDYDPSVDRVVTTLGKRGVPVFRADLGWFPQRLTLDAELEGDRWVGILRTPDGKRYWQVFDGCGTIDLPPFLSPMICLHSRCAHAEREARFGVGGVLSTLPVTWIDQCAESGLILTDFKPSGLGGTWCCSNATATPPPDGSCPPGPGS